MAVLLSLTVAKASQQAVVGALDDAFGKEIHFGMVSRPRVGPNIPVNTG